MKPLSKDLENIIEESKYQIRLEIAEKCLAQKASLEFIMNVCSLNKEEIIAIFNDLKKTNPSIKRLIVEQNQVEKHEMILEITPLVAEAKLTLKKLKEQERELRVQQRETKRIEKRKTLTNALERQKEAEIQRRIAAENTRLLMERIKEEQKNNKLMDIEPLDLKEQKIEKNYRKMQTQNLKNFKKESLDQELDFLNKEQKMIASVGKCYLRGLNVEQAILFSKQSKEDVERIYKKFKNK